MIIAEELGIKHPTNLKTGYLVVMTTDFLVTICKVITDYGEENNLSKEQLRKYYEPLENRVLSKNLVVDIYIPILFIKFEKSIHDITHSISIVEMTNDFQKSRSEIEPFLGEYLNQD